MKKSTRVLISYLIFLAMLLGIAMLLSNGMNPAVSRRIEYPELLSRIKNRQVAAVAIRGTTLVGLNKDSRVRRTDFPETDYDFETTIGEDFIETARQIVANREGKSLEEISVDDLGFDVQYRAAVARAWWYDFLPFLITTGHPDRGVGVHDAQPDGRRRQGDELWPLQRASTESRDQQDHLCRRGRG